MAISERDQRGRVASSYEEHALYEVVRKVAEHARPEDPTALTQSAFDAARAEAGFPKAPTARAICMRLARNGDGSFPWRELLELVLDSNRSIEQTHAVAQGEKEAKHLNLDHVRFALNLAVRERDFDDSQGLTPDRYAAARDALIARDRRRRSSNGLIEELLPTVGQVERIAGVEGGDGLPGQPWDRALELAGLPPRRRRQPAPRPPAKPPSLPLVELIHHYVESNGEWPSTGSALIFARRLNIRVEARTTTKRWREYIEEAKIYRARLGLGSPTEPPKATGRGRHVQIRVPESGIPGAPPRDVPWPTERSEEDCIRGIQIFLAELEPGINPTQKRYLAASVGREDMPAPSRFANFGGWRVLLRKARR